MTSEVLRCVSPVNGTVHVERPAATTAEVQGCVQRARAAQVAWRRTPLSERASIAAGFLDAMDRRKDEVARELAWQMGRPVKHGPLELRGFRERAEYMIGIATEQLADVPSEPRSGFTRFVRREPVGVVLVLAPWNYPYLTAVNSVIPALMAGNSVVLKHSTQTMLCAEHFASAFAQAGLPPNLFQVLHCRHELLAETLGEGWFQQVSFTGSVDGGLSVQRALAGTTAGLGLELGGKDPAYVRADADVERAAVDLADGAFFNAGQSCCGIERIYVHESLHDRFVEAVVAEAHKLRLGDPLDEQTTLGPVVRDSAARFIREQIDAAVAMGARACVDPTRFASANHGATYLPPQVLTGVHHGMDVMRSESFGPVVGIQTVRDDAEAITLMNDSDYGLTASIWTSDEDAAREIGDDLETGTVFMNRCDYLDPSLAWTGVKRSGRGCTLSRFGYDAFVRPKSFHLRA